jgi:hypothetical protein
MIRGLHAMFYSSVAEDGFVTHFKAPGGFAVQLYQPKYAK